MFNKKNKISSSQKYLPISQIEQDVIILKDGSARGILRASPINFDLKSETEQNAIIYGYQSFLNSLQFPIQIVIRSRKLDLERYLVKLESQTKSLNNNLLQIQAQDYINFVRRLIQIANIMSKEFYIIVGYQTLTNSTNPIMNLLPGQKGFSSFGQDQFKVIREELMNRLNIIANALTGLSIKTQILATQEIIELFYNIYNPEESTTERLASVDELEADIIVSGEKPSNQ